MVEDLTPELTCPECGQSQFKTKASLAAHRKFAHDVDGKSAKPSFSEKVLQRLTEIEEKVDGNLNKEVTMASNEELGQVCRLFPGLCQKVDRIQGILESHPKPLKESLEPLWMECPECRELWLRWKEEIKAEALNDFSYKRGTEKAEKDEDFPWVDHSING